MRICGRSINILIINVRDEIVKSHLSRRDPAVDRNKKKMFTTVTCATSFGRIRQLQLLSIRPLVDRERARARDMQ